MPKYSQKVLDAALKTIEAYDKAIAARSVKGWEGYGDWRCCRMCISCLVTTDIYDCKLCPLSRDGQGQSCVFDRYCKNEPTFNDLMKVTGVNGSGYNKPYVVKVLTARRAFLIKRLKENGVEVEHA